MRRKILLALSLAAVAAAPLSVHAASQRDDDARRRAQADAERKKAEKEKQWSLPHAALPQVRNAGPCPFVKVLYDAARYQEFQGPESAANVGFTGEIEGVDAQCQYKDAEPIHVQVAVNFSLGRGPKAAASEKDYTYWIAVTERNKAVLAKQTFTLHGKFDQGEDRVRMVDRVNDIVIPRARQTLSGGNFEILVGFDVTPEMAEFNRLGKRFRVNATAPVNQAAASQAAAAR